MIPSERSAAVLAPHHDDVLQPRRHPWTITASTFRGEHWHLGDDVPADATVLHASTAMLWVEIYSRLARDRNDMMAFTALQHRVARWAERQLTSPACRSERDDVVAETCAAVVLGLDEAYGPDTFAGFVYGHYLNARRRALRSVRRGTVPFGDQDPPDPAERTESTADELALLERCLAELPPRERRAVEMRYFAEASAGEIASALSVTEVNARRIVFNGLARLRRSAWQVWPLGRG
jgi:RNA polymerase sigma factor (sigma-70 family)